MRPLELADWRAQGIIGHTAGEAKLPEYARVRRHGGRAAARVIGELLWP